MPERFLEDIAYQGEEINISEVEEEIKETNSPKLDS